MNCLQCGGNEYENRNIRFSPTVKNETVEVIILNQVCTKCNSPLIQTENVNILRRAAADQYRKKYNLLTSSEIIGFRSSMNMSQREFSEYLKVGEASIKRWETYYIQDVSQDDHIRLKCDLFYAQINTLNMEVNQTKPDIYTGDKTFSFELLKQLIVHLIDKLNPSNISLAQLLFYTDFLHFKNYQKCISGNRYIPLKSGPSPEKFELFCKMLELQKAIKQNGLKYQNLIKSNLKIFDDNEKKTIDRVCEIGSKNETLYHLSQKENGFTRTEDFCYISYDHARELLIS